MYREIRQSGTGKQCPFKQACWCFFLCVSGEDMIQDCLSSVGNWWLFVCMLAYSARVWLYAVQFRESHYYPRVYDVVWSTSPCVVGQRNSQTRSLNPSPEWHMSRARHLATKYPAAPYYRLRCSYDITDATICPRETHTPIGGRIPAKGEKGGTSPHQPGQNYQ